MKKARARRRAQLGAGPEAPRPSGYSRRGGDVGARDGALQCSTG
jgi:hypothetical protein